MYKKAFIPKSKIPADATPHAGRGHGLRRGAGCVGVARGAERDPRLRGADAEAMKGRRRTSAHGERVEHEQRARPSTGPLTRVA